MAEGRFMPLEIARNAMAAKNTQLEVRIDSAKINGVNLAPGEVSSWTPVGAQMRFIAPSPEQQRQTVARSRMFEEPDLTEAEAEAERARVRAVLEEQLESVGVGIDDLTDDIMAALAGENE